MRILTLSTLYPDANRRVFGTFVERQTQGLAAHADVECQVVVPRGLPPEPFAQHHAYRAIANLPAHEVWNGLTVHRPRYAHLPKIGARFDARMMVRVLIPLLTEIRRDFPFDIIDAEFFFPDGPAAIELGAHFNVPVSIKARGSDIHFWGARADTRHQVSNAGRRADGLLAVSAALKHDMQALGMAQEQISVHYTGVDLDLFALKDRAEAKAALEIKGPLIVGVGGLIPRKGFDLVIQALAQIPDATLALAGDGPDAPKLRILADQYGVAHRVRFLGSQSRAQIAQWLAAADVMALPSASEGLANAWVEALACGTPIVITDVGGAPELLTSPLAGRLVARTADAVADGISAILADPPERAAVRAVVAHLTWETNAAALYAHLKGLVEAYNRRDS